MSRIKVDVVSGFLGAGKTTLISKYAAYRIRMGERIAIIENEYGEAGIDGEILAKEGLSVYEIVNGCICCTLKADIVNTLVALAQKEKVDRVLVEPTGIFMLDQIYEILKLPSLVSDYEVGAIVTVVDGINFIKQNKKYYWFFENQIRWAHRIIVSKIAGLEPQKLQEVILQLQDMSDGLEVYAKDWQELTGSDLERYFAAGKTAGSRTCCCGGHGEQDPACCGHEGHEHENRGHDGFSGISVACGKCFTEGELHEALCRIGRGEFGDIPRAKGFVSSCEQGFWEFHLAGEDIRITSLPGFTGNLRASFIGTGMDRKRLEALFGESDSRLPSRFSSL